MKIKGAIMELKSSLQDFDRFELKYKNNATRHNEVYRDLITFLEQNRNSLPQELVNIFNSHARVDWKANIVKKYHELANIPESEAYNNLVTFIAQNRNILPQELVNIFNSYAKLDCKDIVLRQLTGKVAIYLSYVKILERAKNNLDRQQNSEYEEQLKSNSEEIETLLNRLNRLELL